MLYWIKPDSAIPNGFASDEFYIGIFNNSTDNYAINGILGASPVMYCGSGCPAKYYGGADNGAEVFDLYDNFTGNYSSTSNSSVIDAMFAAQNATWKVDNGLSFTQIDPQNYVLSSSPDSIVYMYSRDFAALEVSQDL